MESTAIDPGVINEKMLKSAIEEQGYRGEAQRLSQLEPINYAKITSIRLEFLNILKIDHLWVLTNLTKLSLNYNKIDKIENLHMLTKLTDLDLSFNYIEKIENIEKLAQLEVLSLYSNRVEKIENLHHLERLQMLSLAKNRIKTYDGVAKLRLLARLSVINLEDNPIARDPHNPTSEFVAAFLPQIKYYNYTLIADETRASAREKYSRELRKLEEVESEETMLRDRMHKEAKEEALLKLCFVEFLNREALFHSLFDASDSVLNVDEKSAELREGFKKRYLIIAKELRDVAVSEHERRQEEIRAFRECIEDAQKETQGKAQSLIENYLQEKQDNCLDPSLTPDERLNQMWKTLMEAEVLLFENIEAGIEDFRLNIEHMIEEFFHRAQTCLNKIREADSQYLDFLEESVTEFIMLKITSSKENEIPGGLKDTDSIANRIIQMGQRQRLKIDEIKRILVEKGKAYVKEFIAELHEQEVQRNRAKIIEINYFLDCEREISGSRVS
ncbi:dynein regulatory complex subunit 3 [Phlebotomus argentipes]|uniref:dynein regulatory complex subunit 3 n=1 Tax=Phlebotomus argentipes TaxID=94469 RepID=UPI002892A2A2|nr:dynein regulatory complex subunit 3 [Phlebotomus argentipes]